jgi:isopentenyl-diphosphate Delta-isomerase
MSREKRKKEHIKHALETGQSRDHGFDDVTLVHDSLPEVNMDAIRLDTYIGELNLSSPIIVNAMTGGGSDETFRINRRLAQVAHSKGLAMAVGSQTAALRDPGQRYTYEIVRKEHPQGIVLANLGSEVSVEDARRAVDMLEANALQIHVNVIQELVMPEGDRNFCGTLHRIEQIVRHISVPVIVKEVGFGMSGSVVRQLWNCGVSIVDVSGFGGTNFASIENRRRKIRLEMFDNWGIKTVPALVEATGQNGPDIISSGGIRSPLEVMKSLALGASAVGMAGYFLEHVQNDELNPILELVDDFHEQLRYMMCALGIDTVDQATNVPVVISGDSSHWLQLRGYDIAKFARR